MMRLTTPRPRTVIGATLVRRILAGGAQSATLKQDAALEKGAAKPATSAADYAEGDEVWLWLAAPSNLFNPINGEPGVWAEATVIGHDGDLVIVVTRRMLLKGPVWPAQLRHRKPGEIAPGRKAFGPLNAVAR